MADAIDTRPLWRRARRAVAAHRRVLAALCAAAATASALEVIAPPAPDLVTVLVAARDVAAGTALTDDDLSTVALPADTVPDGALRPGAAVLGRTVGGPVRRGEPLTDVRLVGASLLAGVGRPADVVAVPVRLAEPDAAVLVRAGDRVDVLAAPVDAPDGRPPVAEVVVERALVVAVPQPGPAGDGAIVVVAVPPAAARALAAAATVARLSLALRGTP